MWIVNLNSPCSGFPLGIAIDPNTMFTVGILMIGLVMLRLLLRPRRGGTAKLQSPARSLRTPSHNLDAPVEVGRWEVHMHETARNLMGELNTKMLVLEQLTRDANAAADRLERALAESHISRH
jgi:uncharacterized membrane-anchored protein YhcB (DUF1043 family)